MKQKIEAEGGELIMTNSHGDVAIIPAKDRKKLKALVKLGEHDLIDEYVSKLPKMENYAEDGSFIKTLSETTITGETIKKEKKSFRLKEPENPKIIKPRITEPDYVQSNFSTETQLVPDGYDMSSLPYRIDEKGRKVRLAGKDWELNENLQYFKKYAKKPTEIKKEKILFQDIYNMAKTRKLNRTR